MTSLEALELGEMELIVSQSNTDKKHMEIQMKALLVEVDELKESIETMQIEFWMRHVPTTQNKKRKPEL